MYIPLKYRPKPIQIKNEPLVFTQSDLESNVGLDTSGKLCLLEQFRGNNTARILVEW